uniref:Uncharacterized protein n=1 Tax=Siphoviridae sp. ctt0c4 TaxID=2825702 RepID=A0A8S5V379_9CAUD|nr:MAG TPA: hypothetical protein [Siphoviridae sp. ctt0c4]
MRVAVSRANINERITDGRTYTYPGCVTIWNNIPLKMVVTDLPTDIIVYFYVQCRSSLDSFYVANLEPVNGIEIDLASYFHPLIPAFNKRISHYTVELVVTHRANLTADAKTQTFRMPIMNLASPNNKNRVTKTDTDFRDELGRRAPLAHTLDDDFYIDSVDPGYSYTVEAIYQDGGKETFTYSQGDMIANACQYRKVTIKKGYDIVAAKFYPEETNACGAITLRWLNSCGSYDAISCYNWSTQPTITQGLDGGTVTKRELTCVFELTEANKFALDVLSTSPDVTVRGLDGVQWDTKMRCSSTTGIKYTASGLAKTATLKFQY